MLMHVPDFKGVDFFPHNPRLQFIGATSFIGLSWVLAMLRGAVLLITRGLNYGVDFKGGSLIEVQSKAGAIDIGDMRDQARQARHRRRADPELRAPAPRR